MRTLNVFLDYDDVLNKNNEHAVDRGNKKYGFSYTLDEITGWGLLGNGLDKRLDFFDDRQFVGSIPVREGAREFVRKLGERNVEIFICTSVSKNCIGTRLDDIMANFPMIDPDNVFFGRRKDLLCADVILDDGWHNLENTIATWPVLYRRPWNQSVTGVPAVSDFDEFLSLIDLIIDHKSIGKVEDDQKEAGIAILVGPSGSGKTAIADCLKTKGFKGIRTHTTRPRRYEGEDTYHFVSEKTFQMMEESDGFVETTRYMGSRYGTSRMEIDSLLEKGGLSVMVLDINGAIRMKALYGNRVKTFFIDRDKEACIRSILERDVPDAEKTRRILSLEREMRNRHFVDHVVNNNEGLHDAVRQVLKHYA